MTQAAKQLDLQWQPLWTKPDWSTPAQFGVDVAELPEGTRFYRAWASSPRGEQQEKRFSSEVYEACDAADVHLPSSYLPLLRVDQDRLVAQAAAVRATMREDQASERDMEARALALRDEAKRSYQCWQTDEQERRSNEIEAKEALKLARTLALGLHLLPEEEKRQLRQALTGDESGHGNS